ncbi:hypothetical protein Glove_155g100 [Diversispora epigaea]|uniref:DNA helicase n=1 Tax=Diversispora epigaea TaxID=1348612 RepID=A0A397IUY3_9GLOM|nr:hypothetical protein Glove_155g100 [Diversispora epigaea]
MVLGELLTFISKLFSRIHKNSLEFGGIPVLVVRDLAQLPPINGIQVFTSPVWKNFLLFLTTPHRQSSDSRYYNILQEIKIGELSQSSINGINIKVAQHQPQNNILKIHVIKLLILYY